MFLRYAVDYRLAELAFRVPTHLKIKDRELKYILRRVAADWIHPSCLSMRKKGFSLATHRWIDTALHDLVTESLERLKTRELFVPEAIDQAWVDVRAKRAPYSSVWQLVSTELWMQEMIDSAPGA